MFDKSSLNLAVFIAEFDRYRVGGDVMYLAA